MEISRAWAVGARLKIERGERGKEKKTPFANIMNTLALHSIHRWRTNSQPFAIKRKEGRRENTKSPPPSGLW